MTRSGSLLLALLALALSSCATPWSSTERIYPAPIPATRQLSAQDYQRYVAAGNTQLVLNGMLATLPLVQGGRLKLIGISKRTRMALLPEAPTIAEQGLKDFESGT